MIALVKKAYREDAIIVRLYESQGTAASAALTVNFKYQSAAQTDLLEENDTPIAPAKLNFHPFEIKTVKFKL